MGRRSFYAINERKSPMMNHSHYQVVTMSQRDWGNSEAACWYPDRLLTSFLHRQVATFRGRLSDEWSVNTLGRDSVTQATKHPAKTVRWSGKTPGADEYRYGDNWYLLSLYNNEKRCYPLIFGFGVNRWSRPQPPITDRHHSSTIIS